MWLIIATKSNVKQTYFVSLISVKENKLLLVAVGGYVGMMTCLVIIFFIILKRSKSETKRYNKLRNTIISFIL